MIGGNDPFVLIAGPCVIESESSALRHAKILIELTADLGIPYIYKSSYDKANRTSIRSFRGPGLSRGLKILKRVKEKFNVPILSDVHSAVDIPQAKRVLDVIQIPAFLSRQTDLIAAVARSGRVVNIKKGQFMSPGEMRHAIEKAVSAGNGRVMVTERGASFGYNNLVSDFRSLPILRGFGYPVVYDATHSVQMPAGKGDRSGGSREFIGHLSRAAAACGIDGLFMEVHEKPSGALCDGPNMLSIDGLEKLLKKVIEIDKIVKG